MGGRALAIATTTAAAAVSVSAAATAPLRTVVVAAPAAAAAAAAFILPAVARIRHTPPSPPPPHHHHHPAPSLRLRPLHPFLPTPARTMSTSSSSSTTGGGGSGDTSAAVKQRKAALRKEVAATLKALDDAYIEEQSHRLFARLLALPAVAASRCLSVYLSMPSKEVPTYPGLLSQLMQGGGGRAVYVPKVTGPASPDMVMLRLAGPDAVAAFPKSKWGIPEPPLPAAPFGAGKDDGTYAGQIDLVLVPGVAFDAQCRRLGHGKGYYDCFLARLAESNAAKGGPRPYTVGLALGEQVIAEVPTDTFDLPLDAVVTPDRVYMRGDGGDGDGAAVAAGTSV